LTEKISIVNISLDNKKVVFIVMEYYMVSKKIFIISLLTVMLTGSTIAKNYDEAVLKVLVQETMAEFDKITEDLDDSRSIEGDKAKKSAQERVIRKIKSRLKKAYKSIKDAGGLFYSEKKELYRAYKEQVYRAWKSGLELPLI
jgi:hypothetical protein